MSKPITGASRQSPETISEAEAASFSLENLLLSDRPLDRLLRFAPSIAIQWEKDLGATRVSDLRKAILVGIVLYNAFNLSDFILIPDTAWLSILIRIAVAMPFTFLLLWKLSKVSAKLRERLVCFALTSATLTPMPAFVLSHADLVLFAFPELFLVLVFGNMLLAMRFRYAIFFTLSSFIAGTITLWMRGDCDLWLKGALIFQLGTVCILSLYGNYLAERRHCESYLVSLAATLRSAAEEKARRRFQDLSVTDALTSLPNRRLLNQRISEWSASGASVSVAMIDVDHFKLFNDTFGHPAGDECLKHIAKVLQAVTKDGEIIAARFGGEEFVIALRGANELRMRRLARDLVRTIEDLRIPHPARLDGISVVTASIGIASLSANTQWTVSEILTAADEALYDAKRGGRNRFA